VKTTTEAGATMLTQAEAQSAVEASLRARNPTRRMTPVEMLQFCQRMHVSLLFRSKGDRMSHIRKWAERWESTWLRANQDTAAAGQ
jgi:hypothetical protein